MGLLINFPLLVQVQRRWDRAHSQMGRLREQAAVLDWLPVRSLASFPCPLLQSRPPAPDCDFWKPTTPAAVRSDSALPNTGKDVSCGAASASAAGLVCCFSGNMVAMQREDMRHPVGEQALHSLTPHTSPRQVVSSSPEDMGLPNALLSP